MNAYEIAKDFISTMNPDGWEGYGDDIPKTFNTASKEYSIGGENEKLVLSFEYDELYHWMTYCQIYEKNDLKNSGYSESVCFADILAKTVKALLR